MVLKKTLNYFCSTKLETSPLAAFAKSLVDGHDLNTVHKLSSREKWRSQDSIQDCWVRSVNATIVLCCPPKIIRLNRESTKAL